MSWIKPNNPKRFERAWRRDIKNNRSMVQKRDINAAIVAAETIADLEERSKEFRIITIKQIEAGFIEDAIQTSGTITYYRDIVQVIGSLTKIAIAQQKERKNIQSEKTWKAIHKLLNQISNSEEWKSDAFIRIAKEYDKAKYNDKKEIYFSKAIKEADGIQNNANKSEAFIELTKAKKEALFFNDAIKAA